MSDVRIESLETKVGQLKRSMDNRFKRVNRRIKQEQLSTREAFAEQRDFIAFTVEKAAAVTRAGFEKVDKRFNEVDKRFNQVDKRFNQVERRFDGIDERFDRLEKLIKDK